MKQIGIDKLVLAAGFLILSVIAKDYNIILQAGLFLTGFSLFILGLDEKSKLE